MVKGRDEVGVSILDVIHTKPVSKIKSVMGTVIFAEYQFSAEFCAGSRTDAE